MDGIGINGITLYLTEAPGRKQLAFIFHVKAENKGYVVGYVGEKHEAKARECWQHMLDGVAACDTANRRRKLIEDALNGELA